MAGGEGRNVYVDNVCVDKLGGDLTLTDIQVANNGAERTLTPLVSGGALPLYYSWDLTDMGLGTSTEETVTVFVTQPGLYSYTLTITDANGIEVSDTGFLDFFKYDVPLNFGDIRVATYNVLAFSEFGDTLGLYNALQDPTFEGAKQVRNSQGVLGSRWILTMVESASHTSFSHSTVCWHSSKRKTRYRISQRI